MSNLRALLSQQSNGELPVIQFMNDSFIFAPDEGSKYWGHLVEAIKDNINYKLAWSNCYIEVQETMVYFSMSNGHGGFFIIGLDSYLCINAFKTADDMT